MFYTNQLGETLLLIQTFDSAAGNHFTILPIIDENRSFELHPALYADFREVYVTSNDFFNMHIRDVSEAVAENFEFTIGVLDQAIADCIRLKLFRASNRIRDWKTALRAFKFECVFYRDTIEKTDDLVANICALKRLGPYAFMPQVYNYLDGSTKHLHLFRLLRLVHESTS